MIALLGYCLESIEAATKLGYDFIVVVPPGYDELLKKDGIKAMVWHFDRINEHSTDLYDTLSAMGVRLAVPLFEETVEWSGALNSRFMGKPRLFNRSLLLRDKAMMKRKAQMAGIRVGVFEEVERVEDVRRFLKRVNTALGNLDEQTFDPVHMKPISAAGSVGHRMIRNEKDLAAIPLDAFPCMVESHLRGQEFSCEVFVHSGKIRFMNINEYIHLGHSQLLPPGPKLEEYRPKIRKEVERLIETFEIENSLLHPEYFLDLEGNLNFGEVAARIPGGSIFELIQRAYGFDPFGGQILVCDPETTEEELAEYFPDEVRGRKGHAGNLLVFPKKKFVQALAIPAELEKEPYYLQHNLFEPIPMKIADREGFGNHYGKIDFFGDDPAQLREVLLHFEELDFYA